MAKRLRCKLEPAETGLRAVIARKPASNLHDGTTIFATVQTVDSRAPGWFWYTTSVAWRGGGKGAQ